MSRYKIGQLSKTMGVSSHLLKHYEKFDLVRPIKDDSTNYRYYTIAQCARIIASRSYRNMGFSLKDTSTLLNEADSKEIDFTIEQRIEELDAQIRELELQKYLALEFQNDCKVMDRKLDQWFIEEMGTFYFMEQTNNKELIEEEEELEKTINLLEYVPMAKAALLIDESSFQGKDLSYHWGVLLEEEKIEDEDRRKIEESKNIYKVKGQRMFVTYLKVEVPFIDNYRLINEIKAKYLQFGESLTSDVYAKLIKTETVQDKEFQYFAIYIPIKPVG